MAKENDGGRIRTHLPTLAFAGARRKPRVPAIVGSMNSLRKLDQLDDLARSKAPHMATLMREFFGRRELR